MKFTVFIDESGEAGIAKIRDGTSRGASPYFVLGAAVFQPEAENSARQTLDAFKKKIGKTNWKHATDLGHSEKVLLARSIGNLQVRLFALISNKATLGDYKETIDSDPQKFYNKCVSYLLERVCAYLIAAGAKADEIKVTLERRNHDYDRLIRYIGKVKENPLNPASISLRILNPFSITTKAKGEEDLLEIADFVAHAVYQLGNKIPSNYEIPEPRYFQELSSRFAGDNKGVVTGAGLKCIHSLEQLKLDFDVEKIVRNARARLPKH